MPDEKTIEMTPMEAWHIISANLADLYRRRSYEDSKGYCNKDIQAEVICFKALQEMEKRGVDND